MTRSERLEEIRKRLAHSEETKVSSPGESMADAERLAFDDVPWLMSELEGMLKTLSALASVLVDGSGKTTAEILALLEASR